MTRILLGLLPAVAASGCARAPVSFPLCDVDGAPACGNVGQVGRPEARGPARSRELARERHVAIAASRDARPKAGSLLAPGVNVGITVARPLLDGYHRPAPGNCQGKCGGDGNGFELESKPPGATHTAATTPAHLTGSRIAAVGDGALVIDEDSGMLILTDQAQRNVAYVELGRGAGLLTYDAASRLAYIADRRGNRIAVVRVGAGLELVRSWATPVEPYGVALAPDRRTLLVSTIADRTLVAYDPDTGTERWRRALSPEPRGIAIAPDGKHAIVASLATGAVDRVDLVNRRIVPVAIAVTRPEATPSFARAAFAVTYMGNDQAVVPFQRAAPAPREGRGDERRYGGGSQPIQPELAFVGTTTQARARIPTHLPRAIAWDDQHDVLYVAGMGTDLVQEITNASRPTIASGRRVALTNHGAERCGPDGVAVAHSRSLLVWCAFTRQVARLDFATEQARVGPSLVASALTAPQHAGMVLFHASDERLSARGGLACATCHPDGRSDGLSWSVTRQVRQTPVLAGRVVGTHPFKWDGTEPTLRASVAATTGNLGGRGVDAKVVEALTAYLEVLPPIGVPSRDPAAVARGKQLFDAEGCRECHGGAGYTDHERHDFAGALPSDTPSLLGLAAGAPYYHDGSAPTLEAVVRGRGSVHGMADTSDLTDREVADLTTFLETL